MQLPRPRLPLVPDRRPRAVGQGPEERDRVACKPERRPVDDADAALVRVDVHERLVRLGGRRKEAAAGRDVVEPRPHREHEVGPVEQRELACGRRVVQVPGVVRMAVVERRLPLVRRAHGHDVRLGERSEGCAPGRRRHAGAGERERPPSRPEQELDVVDRGLGRRRPLAAPRLLAGVAGEGLAEDVLRQHEHGRAWCPRLGGADRARDELLGAARVVQHPDPLREAAEHLQAVELLEDVLADLRPAHVADEEEERRGVLRRRVDADARVRRARAAVDEADAGPAGQLRIRHGHERRRALVAGRNHVDLRRVVEDIQDRQVALAGDAEDAVDASPGERRDEPARDRRERGGRDRLGEAQASSAGVL